MTEFKGKKRSKVKTLLVGDYTYWDLPDLERDVSELDWDLPDEFEGIVSVTILYKE